MPAAQNRTQLRSEELVEFPMTGPFGGIQSELPITEIEQLGFVDCRNMILRKGTATVRPGYNTLANLPNNKPALGIADFYNLNGVHLQVAFSQDKMYKWNGTTWVEVTGAGFGGSASQLFGWDIVGYKLCFSQGADKIWYWDGVAAGYVNASANAPAAQNIAEINLHLMCLNTLEGGTQFPQRYRWSGIGDVTDWTSVNAGVNDNLNNLGPGQGLIKLGQYGYGFHFNGIVQIQPTGIGTNPFAFFPIINASIGNIAQGSLDHSNKNGIEFGSFLSYDNVYLFNQSGLEPIGDKPLDGRRRVGARSRILADVLQFGNLSGIKGFITNSINGQPFNAYWLLMGSVCWVYNFDEENWMVFNFNKVGITQGKFFKAAVPRIIDLVGQIVGQSWTPVTLINTNPFQGHAISFSDNTFGYIDFTNYSESDWSITGPAHIFTDARHKHTLKKFRLRVVDNGQTTFVLTITNNYGQSISKTITLGNGSGDIISAIVEFNLSGLRLNWKVSGSSGSSASFVEFCPIFDIAGEQRGGSADEPNVVIA